MEKRKKRLQNRDYDDIIGATTEQIAQSTVAGFAGGSRYVRQNFQNSVLQFKETTDRTIGVIDAEGTVIACSELTAIGKRWSKYVEPIVSADGTCVALEGKCFKALPSWGNTF